jgi:hypothetical protein
MSSSKLPDDEMRALPSPDAKELSELYLLEHDLNHSVQALRILIEVYEKRKGPAEVEIIRLALYRDAIVQFVACFDGTAPLFLKVPQVYPSDPNAQSYFDSLKALRDTFAAHRGGPARQCVVGVVAGPTGPLGVGHMKINFHVPEELELKHTHDFMFKARRHVRTRIDAMLSHVTADAMAMTREAILSLPGAHGYSVPAAEMRLSRDRLTRRRRHAAAKDSTGG